MNNKSLLRLEQIRKKNTCNLNWKNRDLYRFLYKEEFYRWVFESSRIRFITTYEDIACEVSVLISLFKNNRVSPKELCSTLPNSSKILKPIGNLLIEALLAILEAVYGFSLGSCRSTQHDALRRINQGFANVNWVILGNYSLVDIGFIFSFLSAKILDRKFLCLLKELLSLRSVQTLMVDGESYSLFSLLIGLYFRKLDVFFEFQRGFYFNRRGIQYLSKVRSGLNTPPILALEDLLSQGSVEFKYIRYRNSLVIGVLGGKISVNGLKEDLTNFLQWDLNINRTIRLEILPLHNENFLFCDYFIGVDRKVRFSKLIQKPRIRMEVPVLYLLKKFYLAGFCDLKGRSIIKRSWMNFKDASIFLRFNSVLDALFKHYAGIDNPKKLIYIQYLLKGSCLRTIACKHRVSLKIFFETSTFGFNHFGSESCLEGALIKKSCFLSRRIGDFRKLWYSDNYFPSNF